MEWWMSQDQLLSVIRLTSIHRWKNFPSIVRYWGGRKQRMDTERRKGNETGIGWGREEKWEKVAKMFLSTFCVSGDNTNCPFHSSIHSPTEWTQFVCSFTLSILSFPVSCSRNDSVTVQKVSIHWPTMLRDDPFHSPLTFCPLTQSLGQLSILLSKRGESESEWTFGKGQHFIQKAKGVKEIDQMWKREGWDKKQQQQTRIVMNCKLGDRLKRQQRQQLNSSSWSFSLSHHPDFQCLTSTCSFAFGIDEIMRENERCNSTFDCCIVLIITMTVFCVCMLFFTAVASIEETGLAESEFLEGYVKLKNRKWIERIKMKWSNKTHVLLQFGCFSISLFRAVEGSFFSLATLLSALSITYM